MKTIVISLALAAMLAVSGYASAALCNGGQGMMYTQDMGKCQACGQMKATSRSHKLCPACSANLRQCEHCRKSLDAAPGDSPKPAPKAETPEAQTALAKERAAKLKGDLGWEKALEPHLLGLRACLDSEALRQMDVLLSRLGMVPPSPAPERD